MLGRVKFRDTEVIKRAVCLIGRSRPQDGLKAHGEWTRVVVGRDSPGEFPCEHSVRRSVRIDEIALVGR